MSGGTRTQPRTPTTETGDPRNRSEQLKSPRQSPLERNRPKPRAPSLNPKVEGSNPSRPTKRTSFEPRPPLDGGRGSFSLKEASQVPQSGSLGPGCLDAV